MLAQEKKRTSRRTNRNACCGDASCRSGMRNNYFERKRLSVESYRVEQSYSRERRQLLNKAIYGWGVVYGYAVEVAPPDQCNALQTGLLNIGSGLALDTCGRELVEADGRTISMEDVIVVENGKRVDPDEAFAKVERTNEKKGPETCWLLCAHYAEQPVSPVAVSGACQCQHQEWDYTCETVRYSLQPIGCDRCCHPADCELECECPRGGCCGGRGASIEELRRPRDGRKRRGGCRCLCDYLTKLELDTCCTPLCNIEDACCVDVRVDLRHCVPLACVEVARDNCGEWSFGKNLEACGPRRLVKRNDLLFDLIRGCDLTRIVRISWADWHRRSEPVSFEEFSNQFGSHGQGRQEYVTSFTVEFSRPVYRHTLCADCFAITVMSAEREGGWLQMFRVPIVRIDSSGYEAPEDPGGDFVMGGAIVVQGSWLEDAVRGRQTRFIGAEASVAIEIRGNFILDCNGQAVDANALGLYPHPSGNGTPGGTFLSTFRVAPEMNTPFHRKGASQ